MLMTVGSLPNSIPGLSSSSAAQTQLITRKPLRGEQNRKQNTVNVDIFACINFCGFMKLGNFACIKIRVLCIIGSIGFNKCNFRGVHIFSDI